MIADKKELRGVITKGIGGFYYVSTENKTIECRARGKFRRTETVPIPGDIVSVLPSDDKSGSVVKIFPRKNELIRPEVANIDMLVLVVAARSPLPDYMLTDKLLVMAESQGIEAMVCLNKTDLASPEDVRDFCAVYEKAYPVISASATLGEGTDKIRDAIFGKCVCFAGLSGVGKSSLIKKITGIDLKCGSVSKIERGKHTTRHTELFPFNGGYVFDTPGFSMLSAQEIRADMLWQYFPEIREYHGKCRFRTCNHRGEPDCAVEKAMQNGLIAQSRLKNYIELYNKLSEIKDWQRKG